MRAGAVSRRGFVRGSVQGFGAALALSQAGQWAMARAAAPGERLLIGTGTGRSGSKGVYGCTLDAATGELTEMELAAEAASPTFLALSPDKRFVYAVEEVGELNGKPGGGVVSFRMDAGTGALHKINEVSSGGAGPCHVSTDRTGRCLFVANYSGGSATSYTVDGEGTISAPVSHFQYEGKGPDPRQEKAHAHRVTASPGNRFLLVNDLGLDRIHVYHLNAKTAELTPNAPDAWVSPAGAGPRALRFHPNGKLAYCLCELTSTVYVLRWDEAKGTLETLQAIPLLPDRSVTSAAEIVFDRAMRFGYASNRVKDNFITTFAVDAGTGKLRFVAESTCGGKVPRHTALDPSERWLVVANQESGSVAVIQRNGKTGRLAETAKTFPVGSPQCCLFV